MMHACLIISSAYCVCPTPLDRELVLEVIDITVDSPRVLGHSFRSRFCLDSITSMLVESVSTMLELYRCVGVQCEL